MRRQPTRAVPLGHCTDNICTENLKFLKKRTDTRNGPLEARALAPAVETVAVRVYDQPVRLGRGFKQRSQITFPLCLLFPLATGKTFLVRPASTRLKGQGLRA